MARLRFDIQLPPPLRGLTEWDEVVGSELRVRIDDREPIVLGITKWQQEQEMRVVGNEAFVGEEGERLTVEFFHIDDEDRATLVGSFSRLLSTSWVDYGENKLGLVYPRLLIESD